MDTRPAKDILFGMSRDIISADDARWLEENDPRWLTTYDVRVWSEDGVVTLVQAYQLDVMLERGFLDHNPNGEDGPVVELSIPEGRSGLVIARRVYG